MDGIVAMADSLTLLRGATRQFMLDVDQASAELLLGRSRDIRERCEGVAAAGTVLDTLYAQHSGVIARDRGMTDFRRALKDLQEAVARCDREWRVTARPTSIDSVRAWGPHRVGQLESTVRKYADAAGRLPYPKPKPAGTTRVGSAQGVDSHFHMCVEIGPTAPTAAVCHPQAMHMAAR